MKNLAYRQYVIVSLLCFMLLSSSTVFAQFTQEEPLSENGTVNHVGNAFLNQSERNGSEWADEDAVRFVEGLLNILEAYEDDLGDVNTRILREHLVTHVQEMANTVLTNGQPPSEYIDAFLSDYTDRVSTLANRGGPIFPDEFTRNVIKSELNELVEYSCQDLNATEHVSNEKIADIKEQILLELYWRADHPLRSEFKKPLEDNELQTLKNDIRSKVTGVDFSQSLSEMHNRTVSNEKLANDLRVSQVRRHIVNNLIRSWHVEPILMSSAETSALYKAAFERLKARTQSAVQNYFQD